LGLKDCLDIGAGTGAFHEVIMGTVISLDVSPYMLSEVKEERVVGDALKLPFRSESFRSSFVSSTLCFVDDVRMLLSEMRRVSREVLGICFIPLDSPLGEMYDEMGRKGHKYYSKARFLSRKELYAMLEEEGLRIDATYSTLSRLEPVEVEDARVGDNGSFVCLRVMR